MNTNFINYFDKFGLNKTNLIFKFGISCMLILLILLNINLLQNKLNQDLNYTFGSNNCIKHEFSNSIENIENYNIKKIDISLFPEVENFFCIGSIVDYKFDDDGNLTKYIATSTVALNYILLLINAILCLYLLISNEKKEYKLLLIFYFSNFLSNLLMSLSINDAVVSTIFPIINPEGEINNVIFQNLFLIFFVIKNKNKKSFIFGFLYFIFISIDFLGFFVILYFVNSNFKINLNKREELVLYSSPIIFYSIRILSSFLEFDFYYKGVGLIDFLWINSGQRIYRGFRRYPDMEATLFGFQCNVSSDSIYTIRGTNLNCFDNYLRMGPSSELIFFSGNIEATTLIIMNIFLVFLIVFYIYGLNIFKKYKFIIFLLVISPPLNFVTFLGNIDLIIFVILLMCLSFFSNNNYLLGTILFLLSIFKLHPAGGLVGLIVYSLYVKNRNLFFYNSFLLSLFFYFIIGYETESNFELVYWSNVGLSYGFFNDSLVLNNYLGLNSVLGYIFILIFSYFIYRKLNLKISKIKNLPTEGLPLNFIFIFLFWFIETALYTNNTYRLSIFSLLFLDLFIRTNKKVKFIILLAVFLEPTLLFENKTFELFIGFINSLSLNILFMYLINSFFKSFTDLKLNSFFNRKIKS